MELAISCVGVQLRIRPAHRLDEVVQPGQGLVSDDRGRQGRRLRFEQGARLCDLERAHRRQGVRLLGRRADKDARPGLDRQLPLSLKRHLGFAHGHAADAEPLGQLALARKLGPRPKPLISDELKNLIGDRMEKAFLAHAGSLNEPQRLANRSDALQRPPNIVI
ncbi:hypothetical protein D3C87_1490980 [compost metagenome]